MVNVAILGFGTVGSGVAEVIHKNGSHISEKVANQVAVKYILDIRDFPDSVFADKIIHDFSIIENDPEVDVVVETIGGATIALDYTRRALNAGKSVVTSNKELVATHGYELLQLAKEHGVSYLFEASVGGGIPIIRPISQCLAANEMTEIAGILNGTTNFILTKMIREGMAFDDALKLAQQLGYAERDPSADVEGIDACRKICILASLAYGTHVYPDSVHTEGITAITKEDVGYAGAWGGVIKLIGEVKKLENGRIHIQVAPMFISRESQLANVDDVFNGILVRGDATGDVVFYGKGAGKLPTASAVVADVIDCVRHLKSDRKILFWEDAKPDYVQPWEDTPQDLFLRVAGEGDSDSLFDKAQQVFPSAVRLIRKDERPGEAGFTVGQLSQRQLEERLPALRALGVELENRITIADF